MTIKNILIAACLSFASIAHSATDFAAEKAKVEFQKAYPGTNVDSVRSTDIPGLFEVVAGKNVFYISAKANYFLFGNMLKMPEQKDLTALRQQEVMVNQRVDVSQFNSKDAIVYRANRLTGTVAPKRLLLFADANCGFCRRMENTLAVLGDVQVEVYPVAILGETSLSKAVAVLCSPSPAATWRQMMVSGSSPEVTEVPSCDHPVNRNTALYSALGMRGTPAFISGDGRVFEGALEEAQLRAFVSGSNPTTATP